jgi:hypothetical protein
MKPVAFCTPLTLLLVLQGLSIDASGQANNPNTQIECESRSTHVKAAASAARSTAVTYNSNPLVFDPVPLVSTKIRVGGERQRNCLVAHFSAMVGPMDNHIVFQARVDGVPMTGHLPEFVGILVPVVVEPDFSDAVFAALGSGGVPFADVPQRMVAYNFFRTVKPGEHTVEVLFAGCCSSNPLGSGAVVNRATLILEFRGAAAP